jgi:hypothetical protein
MISFALIRTFYNRRSETPNSSYNRLTFVLLGVATPTGLIQDKQRTPFNIGQAIALTGFCLEEAEPLEQGLRGIVDDPKAVIQQVLSWTGGQPFLTQKVCQLIVEFLQQKQHTNSQNGQKLSAPMLVEAVVRTQVIENWESQDEPEHLCTIRDRLLEDESQAGKLLGLYQKILNTGTLCTDSTTEQIYLRLSGLTVKTLNGLEVCNRIYSSVFDLSWVDQTLSELRPYAVELKTWLYSARRDKSCLLRGQALDKVLHWAEDKSLTSLDEKFLRASLILERQESRRRQESKDHLNKCRLQESQLNIARLQNQVQFLNRRIENSTRDNAGHPKLLEARNTSLEKENQELRSRDRISQQRLNQFQHHNLALEAQKNDLAHKFSQVSHKLKICQHEQANPVDSLKTNDNSYALKIDCLKDFQKLVGRMGKVKRAHQFEDFQDC